MVLAGAAVCLALAVSLSSFDVAIPTQHNPDGDRPVYASPDLNITGIRCPALRLADAVVDFANTRAGFAADRGLLNCTADMTVRTTSLETPIVPGTMHVAVTAPRMAAWVALRTGNGSCVPHHAALTDCTAERFGLQLWADVPRAPGSAAAIDLGLAVVGALLRDGGPGLFCRLIAPGLVAAVMDRTAAPATPIPPLAPWATPMTGSSFATALAKVANSLPPLGPMRLHVAESPAAFRIGVSAVETVRHKAELTFGHGPSAFDLNISFVVPARTELTMTVVGNGTCSQDDRFAGCVVPEGQLRVINVGVAGHNETHRFLNDVLSQVFSDVLNAALTAAEGSNATVIGMPLDGAPLLPPPGVACGIGVVVILATITAVLGTCLRFRRCTLRHVATQRRVCLCEKVATDGGLVLLASGVAGLYAYIHAGLRVEMVLGGALPVHQVSVFSSIRSAWDAGVYPLAALTCLFGVVYPYVKCGLIVLVAVVLQRPQSRVLQAVDLTGKMALMNKFVLAMTQDSMIVPGLFTMKVDGDGSISSAAILASMLVGVLASYAPPCRAVEDDVFKDWDTSFLDSDHSDRPAHPAPPCSGALLNADDDDDDIALQHSARVLFDDAATEDTVSSAPPQGSEAEERPLCCPRRTARRGLLAIPKDHGRPWDAPLRPAVGLPLAALFAGAAVAGLLHPTITIHRRGLMTLLLGDETSYTLVDLFAHKGSALYMAETFATTCVLPALFALGFARARVLASFCALDAFVIAGLAGLLQLDRLVGSFLSPGQRQLLHVTATFEWPFGLIAVAAAAQVFAVGAVALHRTMRY